MPEPNPTAIHTPPAIGARVLVELRDGWVPGVLTGYRAADHGEDFQRLDVALDDGRTFRGAHPDCVTPLILPAVARG